MRYSSSRRPRLLRSLLVLILGPLVASVVIVGISSYFTADHSIDDAAARLLEQGTERTAIHTKALLSELKRANRINAEMLAREEPAATDLTPLRKDLFRQIRAFPHLDAVYVGTETDHFAGYARIEGEIHLMVANPGTGGAVEFHAVDDSGEPLEVVTRRADFPIRERPWYRAARERRAPVWSEVFPYHAYDDKFAISHNIPVYDQSGTLRGVVGANFFLDRISSFLREHAVTDESRALVIESDGRVIADSTGFAADRREADPFVANVVARLTSMPRIPSPEPSAQLEVRSDSTRYDVDFVRVTDDAGLDWIVVTAIPQDQFTRALRLNAVITVATGLVAIAVSALLAWHASRRLLAPLMRLKTASAALGDGHWEEPLPVVRDDEVGEMTAAFNQMSEKLKATLASLENEISERKAREVELQKWKTVFEQATWGIAVSSVSESTIELANPAFAEMTGYTQDEMQGMPIKELYPPQAIDDYHNLRKTLQQRTHVRFETMHRRKNGEAFPVLIDVSNVYGDEGEPLYRFANVQDLSKQRALEEKLLRSQKMESLGTMAGGMAHEFNNLLQIIVSHADLMIRRPDDVNRVRRAHAEITGACSRAGQIISQILTFSRDRRSRFESIDLKPVVEESAALIRAALPQQIRFDVRIDDGLPPIQGDRNQIIQILLNLVNNAQQAYGDAPGSIELEAHTGTFPEAPVGGSTAPFRAVRSGPCVAIEVVDHGPGIPGDIRRRIFDPFFTTREVGKGTGLGLSVVHEVVERHEGTVDVRSEPGVETRFILRFPAVDEPRPPDSPEARAGGDSASADHSASIMIVDDEEAIITTTTMVLESEGYTVRPFSGAAEAWEAFQEDPAGFDCVITDQSMPDMTGLDLIRHIRDCAPGFPAILMTGYIRSDGDDALQQSIVHLVKPVRVDELIETVASVLDGATGSE